MAGVFVAVTALMSGCTASAARSSAKVPLEIPDPPPRAEIAPVPATDIPAPERPLPPPSVRTTAPPLTVPSAAAASPPPAAPPPVVALPEPGPVRPAPPPELRPSGAAGLTQTAAQVREALGRTKQKLDRIDRRQLNAGKRADYDSARRFLAQAEGAVTVNNLMLAQSSAEKAETLVDGLR